MEAGIRLFVERGLQDSSMALLAKEAQVATGSLYNYFESKEELINEIFVYVKQQEVEFLLQHYKAKDSYESRFKSVYRASIQFMLDHCPYFRFMHLYSFSPIIKEETRQRLHPLYEPLVKLYEDAYSDGVIRSNNILAQHLQIYGGISYFIHWAHIHQEAVTESDIQQLLDFVWAALKSPTQ